MNTWDDFENEARSTERMTRSEAGDCVCLLQDAIGIFGESFSLIKSLGSDDAATVKMSFLSQNFNGRKCSSDLAFRGFYTQSMNLLRNVFLNWVAFHYVTVYPFGALRKRIYDFIDKQNSINV